MVPRSKSNILFASSISLNKKIIKFYCIRRPKYRAISLNSQLLPNCSMNSVQVQLKTLKCCCHGT